MKVLVVGKGGREHALVWKLAQSPRVIKVYCAPGNAGTAVDGENVPIEAHDFAGLIAFAKREKIHLTVIGPEDPLAAGIVDAFQAAGLRVFGPTKAAAQIEASKVFSKRLMRHADVPTAEFHVFDHPQPARQYLLSRDVAQVDGLMLPGPFPPERISKGEDGRRYVKLYKLIEGSHRRLAIDVPERFRGKSYLTHAVLSHSEPCVVKADGLAAGKGVFVCDDSEQALVAIERIMTREEFGRAAGRQIVIERRLEGEELSVFALVSHRTIVPLPPTQDHKRLLDGDRGPNTGGMGAYCPAPKGTPELLAKVDADIFVPIVHAMKRNRIPFSGCLFAGLMLTAQGPRVLEFNARFGDPETQTLMMRLKTDLLDLFDAVVDEDLERFAARPIEWDPRPAVCVVLASGGYPGKAESGKIISGLDEVAKLPDVQVFHAGTKVDHGRILTDGGRVLGVTALGTTLAEAKHRAYEAVRKIHFTGMQYRSDIADKALAPSA